MQVLDGSVRDAVEKLGAELFSIVHDAEKPAALTGLKHWYARFGVRTRDFLVRRLIQVIGLEGSSCW
jgi:hypothetical protein